MLKKLHDLFGMIIQGDKLHIKYHMFKLTYFKHLCKKVHALLQNGKKYLPKAIIV